MTEGGSSGYPIFDNEGRIVGSLTGGAASCTDLTSPDFYGKLSYHWASNGSPGGSQLKPYLDPDNLGIETLDGLGYGSMLTAYFKADTSVVSIGSQIHFMDQSLGEPDHWEWSFYGADPFRYSGENPSGITYRNYGSYDVKLLIRSGELSDTIVRKNYIRVTPNLYPNPAHDFIVIDLGHRQIQYLEVQVFDLSGSLAREYNSSETDDGIYKVPLGDVNAGTYIMRIKTDVQEDRLPIVIY